MKKYSIVKKLIALLIFLSLILSLWYGLSMYSSNKFQKDYIENLKIFESYNNLISPLSYRVHLDKNKRLHDKYQEFYISYISNNQVKDYYGKIYNKSKPVKCDFENNIFKETIKPQSFYCCAEEKKFLGDAEETYDFYFKFEEMQHVNVLFNDLSEIRENDSIRVKWIPILTSDNLEDITIGLQGSLRVSVTNRSNEMRNFYIQENYFSIEELAKDDMNFLSANESRLRDFGINTIFELEENVDFSKRLEYIENGRILAMGIVLNGCYADLEKIIPMNWVLIDYLQII